MLNIPFAPWPSFTQEEADAVAAVLLSNRVNYWTGEECRSFEREFATWSGSAQAIAVANGTLALDLALSGLRIGSANGGDAADEVIVTPRTFIASVSCVVNAGAVPIFADVDRDSGNICAATISECITKRTRAIIPVHLAGWPCDMDEIMAVARERGLVVIEDCAQAHGASIGDRSVGSIGHVGAWSFCQDKIMTTGGEGGMVTTNDKALWSRMWSFKDHGKTWEAVYERQHAPGFRWLHESFGTNWRMLEMQAAIGRIQLGRMAAWTKRRTEIATSLADTLDQFPEAIRVPRPSIGLHHAYYRLYGYIRPEGLRDGWTRDRIVEVLSQSGVQVFHGTCPEIYQEKAFENSGFRPAHRLPIAQELGETSLMFLTHPTIEDIQLTGVRESIERVFGQAAR